MCRSYSSRVRAFSSRTPIHVAAYSRSGIRPAAGSNQSPRSIEASVSIRNCSAPRFVWNWLGALRGKPSGPVYRACHLPEGSTRRLPKRRLLPLRLPLMLLSFRYDGGSAPPWTPRCTHQGTAARCDRGDRATFGGRKRPGFVLPLRGRRSGQAPGLAHRPHHVIGSDPHERLGHITTGRDRRDGPGRDDAGGWGINLRRRATAAAMPKGDASRHRQHLGQLSIRRAQSLCVGSAR